MTEFNPAQLNRMDTRRLAAYRSNLDFYRGNHWPTQSRNRQLVFNYARVAIDKATSFLMPGLNFACYPVTDAAGLPLRWAYTCGQAAAAASGKSCSPRESTGSMPSRPTTTAEREFTPSVWCSAPRD